MPVFDSAITSKEVVAAFAPHVKGRVCVITGAGQPSIGSSIATELARASPAHILIASRTASNVSPVLAAIREIDPAVKATFVRVDLSDHESVRRAAAEILAAVAASGVDLLINSAGNMALKEYAVDKQGVEMQLSVNHVGHFLLTNLLVPALLAGGGRGPARVVNITSAGYQISPVRFADPSFSGGRAYDPWTGYGQAKTAQILFAYGLTRRLMHKDRGVVAFACHPGSNLDTKLGAHLVMDDYAAIVPVTKRNTGHDFVFTVEDEPRFKTFEQIAATPLIAALDPDLAAMAPTYLQNSRVVEPVVEFAHDDPELVEKCWRLSEELVGEEFRY